MMVLQPGDGAEDCHLRIQLRGRNSAHEVTFALAGAAGNSTETCALCTLLKWQARDQPAHLRNHASASGPRQPLECWGHCLCNAKFNSLRDCMPRWYPGWHMCCSCWAQLNSLRMRRFHRCELTNAWEQDVSGRFNQCGLNRSKATVAEPNTKRTLPLAPHLVHNVVVAPMHSPHLIGRSQGFTDSISQGAMAAPIVTAPKRPRSGADVAAALVAMAAAVALARAEDPSTGCLLPCRL